MSCPDDNALARLADAGLTAAERDELEAHLDECAACSLVVSELGSLIAALPAPVGYRVLARLDGGRQLAESADGQRVVLDHVSGDAARRARVLRDARALIRRAPAGLAAIVDAREDGDRIVLASEVVVGTSARRTRAPAEVRRVWRAVLETIATLHDAGIVHDGLTPDQVIVSGDAITVCGFAVAADHPAYRAPEVRRGEPPSPASDQLALCTAIWEALAGQRPYAGATAGALAVTSTTPPELPSGDRGTFGALRRGLALDPARRWPDLRALRDALGMR